MPIERDRIAEFVPFNHIRRHSTEPNIVQVDVIHSKKVVVNQKLEQLKNWELVTTEEIKAKMSLLKQSILWNGQMGVIGSTECKF